MKLFRIRPDKLQIFLDWGKYLENNPEALETLKEEEIGFEAFYYFKLDEEYYTMGITDNSAPLPASDRELNRNHKAVLKECLERVAEATPVYILKISDEKKK